MANEERLLEQYFEPAHIAERRISEERLESAVRSGMLRGGRAKTRRRIGRTAMSCAAALLLIVAAAVYVPDMRFGGGLKEMQTAADQRIPSYVEWEVGKRGMLREALDQGKYQAVGVTASYEGFHVTVDGMMTDRKHVVLFYTSQSDNGDRIKPVNPGLYTTVYDKLPYKQFVRDTNERTGYYDNGSYRDMLIFDLTGGGKLPDEFYFSGEWDNGELPATRKFLEVKIPVDAAKLAVLERTVPVNHVFDFEGIKIKLENMVQVPERINLSLASDASGMQKFARFLDWELRTKNDRGNVLPLAMAVETEPGKRTFGFYAPDYVKGDPLELRGSWIETAFQGERKLVIDTNQFKLIQAPDDRLKLASIETSSERIRITSGFQSVDSRIGQFLKVKPEFTDGKGNKHVLMNNSEVIHEGWKQNADSGLDEYYFDIAGKSYPQPLTFEVEQYPGELIKKPFSFTIQK
ncbi:hypothetical protein [Paenibacillus sp. USDA918EY]|uniref:hypothetical protein n=1 Tax=Paenibacillus sp. USDA918EY TaxID=2689575 RepID=UPI001357721A|nr:hypothetical protein [Paenibacillus sp. USDA918EY]